MGPTEQVASAAITPVVQAGASAPLAVDNFKIVLDALGALANGMTIATGILAFYIFFKSRKKVSAALQLLLNFAFQTTLGELKEKLERLNEYNCNDAAELAEVRNILHEIAGQLRGNSRLHTALAVLTAKIERLAQSKSLTEPHKRSIVSELREHLRNIQINDIEGSERS